MARREQKGPSAISEYHIAKFYAYTHISITSDYRIQDIPIFMIASHVFITGEGCRSVLACKCTYLSKVLMFEFFVAWTSSGRGRGGFEYLIKAKIFMLALYLPLVGTRPTLITSWPRAHPALVG